MRIFENETLIMHVEIESSVLTNTYINTYITEQIHILKYIWNIFIFLTM